MANCKKCGLPLNKGNIQVVRPRGKKRPYRIHRRCPEVAEFVKPLEAFSGKEIERDQETAAAVMEAAIEGTAGDMPQASQDSTGDPITVEGVYTYSPPPRYRFFITQEQAEKIRRALDKPMSGFGIGVEVTPVRDYLVEADPEQYAEFVEVTVDWKVE